MSTYKADSVTLDIVKDSLLAIGNEIFYAFAQTSMSPIIYETLDYASGIADKDGNLLTQGNGVTGFIGMISPMITAVTEKVGQDNFKPGDVFIINDPYLGGGTHISDVGMCMPIFYKDELIGFAGNKAHWTDVGGMAPGSFTTDATNVYQEGLCFSGVKIVDQGELVPQVWEMMQSNVRYPQIAEGDMWGQIASLRTGYKRLNELCDKYGVDTVKNSMSRLIEQGESVARKRLKEMPKGSWEMEEFIDDDGHGNQVRVQVKVTITDDEFIADFTGSSDQVLGAINAGGTAAYAGVKAIFMSIVNPRLAVNDGIFKPLRIVCNQGSVFHAHRPAPTSCYYESLLYSAELVWKAVAPVFPEYLGAGHLLSVCTVLMAGVHQDTGKEYLIIEPTVGGWGASVGRDGTVGQFCLADGETFNVPVELAESRYGIRIDEYSLNTDGKGAGEFRGGSGCVRSYRSMNDNQTFTGAFGRHKIPVWGMSGGKEGSNNYFQFIDPDGTIGEPTNVSARRICNTDCVIRMVTATGGGYGDPLKRDPDKVAMDVKNEYITIEQALDDYGVIVDPKTFKVTGFSDKR